MKYLLLLLFAPLSSFTQQKLTIEKSISIFMRTPKHSQSGVWATALILSSGDTLFEGSILKLGKGTLPNGDYDFIATASNTNEAKLKRSTTLTELQIVELKRKGDAKYGYKYLVVTGGGYRVQFENAIATGEVIYENGISKK